MKAGFSSVDISPSLGSEVPGGFTKRYLWDVHDSLHAKAAVFEQDNIRIAFVSVDCLSIKASTVREGREIAKKLTGIPPNNIMVAASHTHYGGPSVEWSSNPERLIAHTHDINLMKKLLDTVITSDREYLSFLSNRIGSAVALAERHKVEAACMVGIGKESTASFNRRFKMRNGKEMTHPGKGNPDIIEPAGPIDPDVGVIGVWDKDDKFLGCIVNFACHGTTMGAIGYSADWPYYLDRTIRGVMGEESTVVFLNGACGDITQVNNQGPRKKENGEIIARKIGQKVGAEALKIMAEDKPSNLKPLNASQKIIQIETRKVPLERLKRAYELVKSSTYEDDYKWLFARDAIILNERNMFEPTVSCEIQAIQMGPVVFISNPSELFCQLGLDIKSASHFPYTFVVELANGCIGYVPTVEAMGHSGGGYETRMGMHSFLAPSAAKMIVDTSVELIDNLIPSQILEESGVEQAETPWNYGKAGPDEI